MFPEGRSALPGEDAVHGQATLTISSKNYSSWSLRGWLLCRMAGSTSPRSLPSDDPDDPRRAAAAVALGPGAAPDP
jgi:hypothetical protein